MFESIPTAFPGGLYFLGYVFHVLVPYGLNMEKLENIFHAFNRNIKLDGFFPHYKGDSMENFPSINNVKSIKRRNSK